MRNLTIKRNKNFIACLEKRRVYIKDTTTEKTININKIPCRKLGALKNGEEQTFTIPTSATRIYVISDKLSKNFCNEFYDIPEGSDDITLTGRTHFNPLIGDPFLFDNNNSEDALRNRKNNFTKFISFMIFAGIIAFAVGFLIGFSLKQII